MEAEPSLADRAFMTATTSPSDAIASAQRTIATEIRGLEALSRDIGDRLSGPFNEAITRIRALQGRVIVTGVGKSGHIAHKIASTLASTGTPAFYVHPAEANHGDLGMIARDDAVLALSWSGETTELGGTLAYASRFSIPLIAITSKPKSTLARAADIAIVLPREEEACPNRLAPTTSSLMTLATGDALAIALLESRGFTAEDFGIFHPGGQLGASLTYVRDIMLTGDDVPLVAAGTGMSEAIITISAKGCGCTGVVDDAGRLIGIITDGDLRRRLSPQLLGETVENVMTPDPKTIAGDMLSAEALHLMEQSNISNLMVERDGRPAGIVNLKDLVRLGVV